MQTLILALVFVTALALTIGGYLYLYRERLTAADSARARLRPAKESRHAPSILKDTSVSALPVLNRLLSGRVITDAVAAELRRAGSTATPASFLLLTIVSAVGGVLIGSVVGSGLMVVFFTLVLGASPYAIVKRRQRKRLEAFEEQLTDAIDMLVSAMKAGYSFQAAMNFIGEEMPAPLGPEFARFYDEQRLGMDVRTALLSMQERLGSMDLKMFVTAVLVQRESGGNLSEVLANISGIMRERFAIQGEIQTLTAESRLSARILTALPIFVFVGITAISPEFMRPMLLSPAGRAMLLGAAVSVTLGYFVMMKLADIDI